MNLRYKLKSEKTDDNLLRLICENRNVDYNNLKNILEPTKTSIQNPLIYKNMDLGCKLLLETINKNENIYILVDSDVDGYCSAAMMFSYIKKDLNYEKVFYILQDNKDHGLTENIMSKLNVLDFDLLIIPDAGSNDYEQLKILNQKGIQVLVIDHHETEKEPEYGIIINNQINIFGNHTLSGGGMVLKFLEHLDNLTGEIGSTFYYDLAAVAMVGDVMNMNIPETRFYVLSGLRVINNELLQELYNPKKARNFDSISYDIAPIINAFIRVATCEEKEDLFLALCGYKNTRDLVIKGVKIEVTLAEYISRVAPKIKRRQTTIIDNLLKNQEFKIISDNVAFVVAILPSTGNKNLTGLIANKLVDKYNLPVIVLKNRNGVFFGSGRSTNTFKNFRDYILNLNVFEFAAGHQSAFGCSIKSENLEKLLDLIRGTNIKGETGEYLVDKAYFNIVSALEVLNISELNNAWSKGFEKPLFYINLNNLKGNEIEVIGNKRDTIRIRHNNITYIKFKCSKEEIDELKSTKISGVELVGSFAVNEWMDRIYPQVIINDLELKGVKLEREREDVFLGNTIW